MTQVTRRELFTLAAALGATALWARTASGGEAHKGRAAVERRDLYPEGVASGDPDTHSVILWTRRPYASGVEAWLHVEVAEDAAFSRVVARSRARILAAADWTCRVLVGNLKPARVYWYRFIDAEGNASRTGRTITAPLDADDRPVQFAFVSCQNANMGEQHAYRRMIFDDERQPPGSRLDFVLHLGDFVYEVVWYPAERQEMFGRRFRDILRFPRGEKVADFHIPATLEDYRALYQAYLHDPDIQDARARWPFICIWDNHEFSQNAWQSFMSFQSWVRPAQTLKAAANQAWFEYIPARVAKSDGRSLERFTPPKVVDAPIERFDDEGFGDEPNNRAAVGSLTAYRALRWGRNVEILLTDQRSYRSREALRRREAAALLDPDFPQMIPEEAARILDAGRAWGSGKPPDHIRIGEKQIPNFRKSEPPQSILGRAQKQWFLQRLRESKVTWKIWGSSLGTLDYRIDPQNLPRDLVKAWPGAGYAVGDNSDMSTAYHERAQIYAAVKDSGITGFVTVAGDRHSFWAGLAAPSLPPEPFEPVGIAFVTGSISAPGLAEKLEHGVVAEAHPLRSLFLLANMLYRHGVQACLEYIRTGDVAIAHERSNPDLAPHLSFLDFGGHGFSVVRTTRDAIECEFVCIPRPAEKVLSPDGGPVLYRVVHSARLWRKGELPQLLDQRTLRGQKTREDFDD